MELARFGHMRSQPPDRYPRNAARLFLAMSRSHSGWGWSARHVDALLVGFGFEKRDSSAHTFYRHSEHRSLALAVPHTRRLRPYLVADAVRLVGLVLALEREDPT